MNRDEVIFYFQSFRLIFVLMMAIFAASIGLSLYFVIAEVPLNLFSFSLESYLIMMAFPVLIAGGGITSFRKQLEKARKTWGVAEKMSIYRKALLWAWLSCVLAVAGVAVLFVASKMYWMMVFPGLIVVYAGTTYTTPIKMAKLLQFSHGEVNEFKSFYRRT